jgi:hypothetical protein
MNAWKYLLLYYKKVSASCYGWLQFINIYYKKKAAADLNLVASLGETPTHLNLHHISQYRFFLKFMVHAKDISQPCVCNFAAMILLLDLL